MARRTFRSSQWHANRWKNAYVCTKNDSIISVYNNDRDSDNDVHNLRRIVSERDVDKAQVCEAQTIVINFLTILICHQFILFSINLISITFPY